MPYTLTYRQLKEELNKLDKKQLDCNVTVERLSADGECYPAAFEEAGPNHNILSMGHPIIYVEDLVDENLAS